MQLGDIVRSKIGNQLGTIVGIAAEGYFIKWDSEKKTSLKIWKDDELVSSETEQIEKKNPKFALGNYVYLKDPKVYNRYLRGIGTVIKVTQRCTYTVFFSCPTNEAVRDLDESELDFVNMDNIAYLQRDAWQTAEDKGFHKDKEVPRINRILSRLALVHTEISEAAQEVKRHWSNTSMPTKEQIETFTEELADAVIRILDLTETIEGELQTAVVNKMKRNKERPYAYNTSAENFNVD